MFTFLVGWFGLVGGASLTGYQRQAHLQTVKEVMRGEVETPLLPLQIVAESFRTGTITVPLSATGFETLRQVLFGLIRAMSNTPSITAIYVALDSDGTFLGYYNKGITIGHGEENFTMTLLNGQTCAWDYGADCDADDPTAPCLQGLDQQPDCRRYYDISQTTGVPWCSPPGSTPASGEAAVETSETCWFDEHFETKVYDPRVRPWYTGTMAFAPSDVFYSDVRTPARVGMCAGRERERARVT